MKIIQITLFLVFMTTIFAGSKYLVETADDKDGKDGQDFQAAKPSTNQPRFWDFGAWNVDVTTEKVTSMILEQELREL